jgi:hypothetical protein
MIVVRNVFDIAPGQMKRAIGVAKAGRDLADRLDFPKPRLSVDVTGEFYTLVLETTFADLADFEQRVQRNFASDEWQTWYQEFTSTVRSGRREIFRVVE